MFSDRHSSIDELFKSIDWMIIGGESGHMSGKFKARPCNSYDIHMLIEHCKAFNVPCFVKQLGTVYAHDNGFSDRAGGDPTEWPEWLRVRQFPSSAQVES